MAIYANKKPPENKVYAERIVDFSGGLNTTISGALLNSNEAQVASDISLEQKGTIRPRKGRVKRYSSPFVSTPITGLGTYYKNDGTSRLLISSDDALYTDSPHMSTKWNTKADFEQTGTALAGFASTSQKEGSVVARSQDLGVAARTEDVSLWTASDSTMTLNSDTSYYSGGKSISVFVGVGKTVGYSRRDVTLDATKYYAITAYVKNVDAATGIALIGFGTAYAVSKASSDVVSTSWTRVTLKLTPTEAAAITAVGVRVTGAAGKYAIFCGLFYYSITEAQYNDAGFTPVPLTYFEPYDEVFSYNSESAFNAGTLDGVSIVDGTLKLSNSSASVVVSHTSQADFDTGNKTDVSTTLSPGNVILNGTPGGFDSYVKSLLHFNGDLVDAIGKTWSYYGGAGYDTSVKKFGSASEAFDGTGDWIDTPDHADFDVGSGDFTIDFWVRRNDSAYNQYLFAQCDSSASGASTSVSMRLDSSNKPRLVVYSGTTAYTTSAGATAVTSDSTWHHIACVRYGNSMTIYLDGIAQGTVGVTGVTVNNSSNKLTVGRAGENNGNYFNGWIDEFRFSKGIARWTADFTPPTSEYTASSVYASSGTFTSAVINTGTAWSTSGACSIVFNKTTPTGTTLVVSARFSSDGVTWSEWQELTSSPFTVSTPHSYVQYKAVFSTTDTAQTPTLSDITITYPGLYVSSGTWLSPIIDCSDISVDLATVSKSTIYALSGLTSVGEAVTTQYRCRKDLNDTWSAWADTLAENAPHYQIRVSLTRGDNEHATPSVSSTLLTLHQIGKRSLWLSQALDVSQATSLASAQLAVLTALNSGQVVVYSRSTSTLGGTWSAWSVVLPDGTLTSPEDNIIQILVVLTGAAELQELTLNLDDEAAVTLLADGFTPGAEYSFATLDDTALIVNGNDVPKKWDAISSTPVNLGTDVPVMSSILVHHNRAWGVDVEVPSRVRYSNILDPTVWEAYSFIDFNPDDGDRITAIARYGQNLVVSKLRSMALLTGNTTSNYNVTWLDSETGATGKNAICVADKYLVYVAQDGIRFTDLSQSVIATERLKDTWDSVNKRRLNQAALVYWKNRLFAALPTNDSLHNDIVLVYDFLRNSWSVINGWEVSVWKTFNQYGEEILLAGSSVTGQLYTVDATYYDDTVPVAFRWRSKDFNFRSPEKYKLFRNIFIDIEGVAETSELAVDIYVDGQLMGTYTTTIPEGDGVKTTRRILPPLYGAVLGSSLSLEVRGRCGIQGITIEYTVRGNIPGGDM